MRWQLLHKACWEGDAAEVARLLDAGADPNQVAPTNWRQTPLGRTLEFRITFPRGPGHVETVRVLLERGADGARRSTHLDMTPYEQAQFCGLEAAAEMLLPYRDGGEHPTGMSGLWLAAAARMPEERQLELLAGQESELNLSWRRATPLVMAAGHAGHFRVADRLLKMGADPNAGPSILHASCDWHFEHLRPALRYLAGVGWNVNGRDADGQTALHKAAMLGYAGAVRTLLELGAEGSVRDGAGSTALEVARRWRKEGVAELLNRVAGRGETASQ